MCYMGICVIWVYIYHHIKIYKRAIIIVLFFATIFTMLSLGKPLGVFAIYAALVFD